MVESKLTTKQIYRNIKADKISFYRKIGGPEEISKRIAISKHPWLEEIGEYDWTELWKPANLYSGRMFFTKFDTAIGEDIFILKYNDRKFLVDTSGYDYCRYVCEIY